jgi:glycosyltransferase involved in cell wall biosynthesis
MRIGMILDSDFPPDPRVENEALSLIEAGHEVFLFCLQFSPKLSNKENYNGIQVVRYTYSRIVYKLSALAYTIPLYHWFLKKDLASFISQNNIDTIHIHDIQVARVVFDVNKSFKKKIILDLHENRPEIMKFYTHVKDFWGKLLIYPQRWRYFEEEYIKKSFRTIVVTKNAADYYVDKYDVSKDKFLVVPNTVRKEFYENPHLNSAIIKEYESKFTLVYLGDTGVRRGTLLLLEAINILKEEIPNIKLVLVGKSKSDIILKEYIKINKIEDYVDMLGWQNFSLFPSYISASKIGFSPLLRNIHHDTTYANKIFQYMAFKKPVIVSDSTAQADLIHQENCGLVFENDNSKDLALKILELYNDKVLYTRLSENAEEAIMGRYNWAETSKEMLNFYTKTEKNGL